MGGGAGFSFEALGTNLTGLKRKALEKKQVKVTLHTFGSWEGGDGGRGGPAHAQSGPGPSSWLFSSPPTFSQCCTVAGAGQKLGMNGGAGCRLK